MQRGESTPERSKSLQNLEEVKVVCSVATALRSAHPNETIAVLTFYKGQLLEVMRMLPAALKVEVLTVDACQGSEFDYVVLSTVRSNYGGRLGFVKDQQRICVAISRAMQQLVIVGCADTLAADGCWRTVNSRAEPQSQQHWERLGRAAEQALSTDAGSRSVLDELAKGKADAREAMLAQTAVSLMQQQPSFKVPRQRDTPRRAQSVRLSRATRKPQKNQQLEASKSQQLEQQLDGEQYDTTFPALGASRAPVRALHLVGSLQQQPARDAIDREAQPHPTAASQHLHHCTEDTSRDENESHLGLGGDNNGWDVSKAMLIDMFGETRVGAVVSTLGGDLQRAFVVLLETDGLDDTNVVNDEEWDYERQTGASKCLRNCIPST